MSQRLESAASTRRLTPMKHQGHMRSDTTSTTTGFCIVVSGFASRSSLRSLVRLLDHARMQAGC